MSIYDKLYLSILLGLKFLTEYFNGKLGEYYTRKNHEHADAFLKKFRKGRDDTWSLGKPHTWPRKPRPNPNCAHLKAANVIKSGSVRDFNVAGHRFPDGTIKIWCLNGCGFVSYFNDANWKQAVEMLHLSTNTSSASEYAMKGTRRSNVTAVFQDSVPNGRS